MKKEDTKIIAWILIIAIAIVAAFWLKISSPFSEAPEGFSSPLGAIYIPTVRELQEALCEAGYEVEVDCVIGKETKAAWDSYCADRIAAKFITGEVK